MSCKVSEGTASWAFEIKDATRNQESHRGRGYYRGEDERHWGAKFAFVEGPFPSVAQQNLQSLSLKEG